jgi:hypothetical protein
MFFLFNSLRGALWNKHFPADYSNPFGVQTPHKDLRVTSTKGMFQGQKIEVSEKIFGLNFI